MTQSQIQDKMKKRREMLAVYILTDAGLWRRAYPETFYTEDGFATDQELKYIEYIYEIFLAVIEGHRKTIIEDEINLMYMEIESRAILGKFSKEVMEVVKRRLSLKKQALSRIEALAMEAELKLPELIQKPPQIKFRIENTVYLVRLIAYGLFSDRDIVLERVAEVFDIEKLQAATKPKEKTGLDSALNFLYRGLIQRNEGGRPGSRHAARQTLAKLKEWYPDNEYVVMCLDRLREYV